MSNTANRNHLKNTLAFFCIYCYNIIHVVVGTYAVSISINNPHMPDACSDVKLVEWMMAGSIIYILIAITTTLSAFILLDIICGFKFIMYYLSSMCITLIIGIWAIYTHFNISQNCLSYLQHSEPFIWNIISICAILGTITICMIIFMFGALSYTASVTYRCKCLNTNTNDNNSLNISQNMHQTMI